MRIENIRIADAAGRSRLSGRVVWEDSDRPDCDVYFETDRALADALCPHPDAFLAASLTPALWAGERRIQVQGAVCPELIENLETVSHLFRHWFQLPRPVAIEAKPRAHDSAPGMRRAAVFLSGGLDSLAACRANRLMFPPEHPGSLKDGIIVFGLEVEDEQPFRYVLDALADLAEQAEVQLVPVSTNVRCLNPDWRFWYNAHMGPALCAVVHALGHRFSSVTIAADYDVPHLKPHGSHPLIEPNFSSHAVKIRYHGLTMSRLAKARLIAGWPAALRSLRVCNKPDRYLPGQLNCGECEKCVRTMLELVAVGALDDAPVFQKRELSADIISRLYMSPAVHGYYEELIEPLMAMNQATLAEAVRHRLARARGETGVRGRVRMFDREYLNGSLVHLKRAVFAPRTRVARAGAQASGR